MPNFQEHPGYLFVAATVLPLVSFLLLFLAGGLKWLARRYRESPGMEELYKALGGEAPGKTPAYIALGAIALAFVCSFVGAVMFHRDDSYYRHHFLQEHWQTRIAELDKLIEKTQDEKQKQSLTLQRDEREAELKSHDLEAALHEKVVQLHRQLKDETNEKRREEIDAAAEELEDQIKARDEAWAKDKATRWKGTLFTLIELRAPRSFEQDNTTKDKPAEKKVEKPRERPQQGTAIEIGFAIDHLAVVMFVMVTFVASLIHLFSIGYMAEELQPTVEDHQVHGGEFHHAVGTGHDDPVHPHTEHFRRRGRFGRFFMYLSLFCFSMLNLVLADNLFQVFISWELVGICSYLLIGFYYERTSASNAANKAFITNRIGDAGFIIGLLIVWAYLGTFNFESIFSRVRSPVRDTHGEMMLGGKIVRATPVETAEPVRGGQRLRLTTGDEAPGSEVVLFPRNTGGHFHGVGARVEHGHAGKADDDEKPVTEVTSKQDPGPREYSSMPYWMLVAAGLGIFLGCVGKSAQFPLQVWLPDAMEGPTPVSALIHAATMVAAGVYLVGRCYPLFTSEVLLVIAYTGGITLFVAATIAIVMDDIKKVLAYSTVSQLGYMMLALGVGGWVAGLFHLLTHAFFKALLFLGSGSVIYGCHHEQNMSKMGGLFDKMRITALTMLAGVLAIAGIPLFSGWYSKDSILAQSLGYVYVHPKHILLFLLPLATAGITTFYMFRMWFLTFTGRPRDQHVHEHAHESPWPMTVPLIALGVCSVVVAWGWPVWSAQHSWLEHNVHHAQPVSVMAEFGHVHAAPANEHWPEAAAKLEERSERHWAHELHDHAGLLALGMVLIGIVFAFATYYYRVLDPGEAQEQFPQVYALLANKWYFDELYSALLVRPAVAVALAFRSFDLRVIDGLIHSVARGTIRVARGEGRFDNGIIDWLVNLTAQVVYAIGNRLRFFQTGYLRSYILFLVLATVGIFVLLSYFMALAAAG